MDERTAENLRSFRDKIAEIDDALEVLGRCPLWHVRGCHQHLEAARLVAEDEKKKWLLELGRAYYAWLTTDPAAGGGC